MDDLKAQLMKCYDGLPNLLARQPIEEAYQKLVGRIRADVDAISRALTFPHEEGGPLLRALIARPLTTVSEAMLIELERVAQADVALAGHDGHELRRPYSTEYKSQVVSHSDECFDIFATVLKKWRGDVPEWFDAEVEGLKQRTRQHIQCEFEQRGFEYAAAVLQRQPHIEMVRLTVVQLVAYIWGADEKRESRARKIRNWMHNGRLHAIPGPCDAYDFQLRQIECLREAAAANPDLS